MQNVRNDEVVNRWCLCFPLPSNFPENLGRIWKDIEGSMKLSVKNTSKCCIAANKKMKAKIQHERMSMNVSVRVRAHSIFYRFFIPEIPDTSHSTRSKRKISRTSGSVEDPKTVSTVSTFRRISQVVAGEAPRHRSRRHLKVSGLKNARQSNDVYHVNKYC